MQIAAATGSVPTLRPLPLVARVALVGGLFALVAALERRRPLRRRVAAVGPRVARSLTLAATGALVLATVERPVVAPLARRAVARRRGLVQRLPLPPAAAELAALLLLDYTLYLWHVATHRVSWLWRFHAMHHLDRDLDVWTGLRFHFGELALSVPWRAAQVALIGASPRALSAWQTLTLASILFHHSNLRLPARLERRLAYALVTPRMHGIHHSERRRERESNWSSAITSLWDRLHGTLRLDVPQRRITIGLPGAADRGPRALLGLPFHGVGRATRPAGTARRTGRLARRQRRVRGADR